MAVISSWWWRSHIVLMTIKKILCQVTLQGLQVIQQLIVNQIIGEGPPLNGYCIRFAVSICLFLVYPFYTSNFIGRKLCRLSHLATPLIKQHGILDNQQLDWSHIEEVAYNGLSVLPSVYLPQYGIIQRYYNVITSRLYFKVNPGDGDLKKI